jgi:hypothetical protein
MLGKANKERGRESFEIGPKLRRALTGGDDFASRRWMRLGRAPHVELVVLEFFLPTYVFHSHGSLNMKVS